MLCYPFGRGQERYHLAFRQLANQISRRTGAVLRFDYFGTGDSAGNQEDATFSAWIENTRRAIEELKALSGADMVSLVGLCLGALVAAYASAERTDVEGIVFWDPVPTAHDFLGRMEKRKTFELEGTWWVHGFPLSASFRESLALVCQEDPKLPPRARIYQVQSREGTDFDESWSRFGGMNEVTDRVIVPTFSGQEAHDDLGDIVLPSEIIRAISDWIASK